MVQGRLNISLQDKAPDFGKDIKKGLIEINALIQQVNSSIRSNVKVWDTAFKNLGKSVQYTSTGVQKAIDNNNKLTASLNKQRAELQHQLAVIERTGG